MRTGPTVGRRCAAPGARESPLALRTKRAAEAVGRGERNGRQRREVRCQPVGQDSSEGWETVLSRGRNSAVLPQPTAVPFTPQLKRAKWARGKAKTYQFPAVVVLINKPSRCLKHSICHIHKIGTVNSCCKYTNRDPRGCLCFCISSHKKCTIKTLIIFEREQIICLRKNYILEFIFHADLSSCLPGGLNCKSVSSDAPYTVGRCVTLEPGRDGSLFEELSDTSVGWVVRECRNPHEIADLTCEEHKAPLSDSGSTNTQTRGTEPGAC